MPDVDVGAGSAPIERSRRDPEGRRRAIVEAAAALIVEDGLTDLTHRRVAARAGVSLSATTYYFSSLEELSEEALRLLADRIDTELAAVAETLAAHGGDPAVLAGILHGYLLEPTRVQADTALYLAATQRPALRPLALRWFDGLVEVLSNHVDAGTATALAVYADGVTVHAMLHDEILDLAAITRAVTALMRPDDGSRR
ncbi:TetR/AcrR family transcriptional regulator [Polymorphospora lycopeni]|uniref:TetR family transcriptional regulator n=1 Tax=Polymorphospora lycopeni TaxID=3140240 RepID=A0ABV5CYL4_9ACTN